MSFAGLFSEVGPIWRSMRRHRAFALAVMEVAMGFFIVSNLIITLRWFGSAALPPSGHREADVLEVSTRFPAPAEVVGMAPQAAATDGAGEDLHRRELAVLATLPGVIGAATVSSTQVDDGWGLPNVFWVEHGASPTTTTSGCPAVERSDEGVVVGWGTDAGPELSAVIELNFVAGRSPAELVPADRQGTVIVTRCLAAALLGDAPAALGRLLHSNRHPPARIVGVIEDVRMRAPLLYQTHVTAIFTAPLTDERAGRYLVRTEPGRVVEVGAAARAALSGRGPDAVIRVRPFDLQQTHSAEIGVGTALLLGSVGVSLGVVAVLGNLAVAAFLVGDRRRVIGIRRALGATRWDIFRYLLLETLLPTQLGTLLGLLVTLLALPGAQKLFSGIRLEVVDVILTAVLLSVAGLAAKLFPAVRATRIPPSEVARAP